MSVVFNPISTSGIGFKLEHYVQASYVASLLLETPIPFGDGLLISELNFQAKLLANTDDIIVSFVGLIKYFVQSKKGFEIGSNKVFSEVIESLWKDFNSTDFDKNNSKFIITTDVLSKSDADNALLVLEWARFSKDESDFLKKLKANNQKYAKYKMFYEAIKDAEGSIPAISDIWLFLKAIFIKTYDYLQPGSKDLQILKWYLQPFIKTEINSEHALLELLNYVQTCNQHGATLTKGNIENSVKDLFDLLKSPSISTELIEFVKKSASQLQHTIHNELDGFHIDRAEYLLKLSESLAEKKFTIISGDGGVGKSGLAKDYLTDSFDKEAGFLVFKADQLDRTSLAKTFSDLGVTTDFETLLSQWRLLPRLIIYLDSFEKLYESEHREAFLELLGKLKQTNDNIKIMATCRTFAIETLKTKYRLLSDDIGIVELTPLTTEQLRTIAEAKPKLKKLIANPKLLQLISLPFYLNVASQIVDSISDEEEMDETEFKKAFWEIIIEKKGFINTGIGKKRAETFSNIVLKRAKEKLPYVTPDPGTDLEMVSSLQMDGLLVKHPRIEAYATVHDIFEDIVVIKYLDTLFHTKVNSNEFLQSIDSNPVFRRAVRQWIQQLIIHQPVEAKIFLSEIFPLYFQDRAMIEEILVGILGSSQAYALIKQNAELFLRDDLKLLLKALQLLKVAYTETYTGEHPQRKIKAVGPGWNAILMILDDNSNEHKERFAIILPDLIYHWSLQFEPDDLLPDEGKIVAKHCFDLLIVEKNSYLGGKDRILEILFSVAPLVKEQVEKFIQDATTAKKENSSGKDFSVRYYRNLFEMLLTDTFKCINIYKLFPELIIQLAKMEWYTNKQADDDYLHSSHNEQSFGFNEYPYKYFNASAYQTPFRYLFKYHFDLAFSFLIELSNRAIECYVSSRYAEQAGTGKISIAHDDDSILELYADVNLWSTYRGMGTAPDLLQSALMAFESVLLGAAETDTMPEDIFDKVIIQSNSIMLVGVLASVAMAYPLIFKEKILSILKIKKFLVWDLNRYSHDMMGNSATAIGIDPYYTNERHISNGLKHRRSSLETLMSRLQFYFGRNVSDILDNFYGNVIAEDNTWQLALARMDMRNTTPEIKEEGVIHFNPNPLPANLQEYIDERAEVREMDSLATRIFLWADKAYNNEVPEELNYEIWKDNYTKLLSINLDIVMRVFDSGKKIAAIGIKYFSEKLTDEERNYCVKIVIEGDSEILNDLKTGHTHNLIDIFSNHNFSVLPMLLSVPFHAIVDNDFIKNLILDFIVLLPIDSKKHLISGIKDYAWQIDPDFAQQCFQLNLKLSTTHHLHHEIYRFRTLPQEKLIQEIDTRLKEIKELPDVEAVDIDLVNNNHEDILLAFNSLSVQAMDEKNKVFLHELMKKIVELPKRQGKEDEVFIQDCQIVISEYFLKNIDISAAETMHYLLSLIDKNASFVFDSLKWLTWIAHDKKYPPNFWFHFNNLAAYVLQQRPFYGLIKVLVFGPLKNVYRCNKIPEMDNVKVLHEHFISEHSSDENLIESIFKLIVGVGSIYQPTCLVWIMKSLPDKKSYDDNLGMIYAGEYIAEFVNQLYTNHIDHIRMNKEQLEYFIMLLNLLVDRGSTVAFRMRDELI